MLVAVFWWLNNREENKGKEQKKARLPSFLLLSLSLSSSEREIICTELMLRALSEAPGMIQLPMAGVCEVSEDQVAFPCSCC